jgi:hypothetical protein
VTYDTQGNTLYVYWDPVKEDYVLIADESAVPEGLEKVYYEEETGNGTLNFGNNGLPTGGYADRQHVLLSEFDLMRPSRYNLDPNHLVSAHVELTIDRVIDMSLNGDNMALLPTALFVNAFVGDGVLNDFANAQEDFERVDRNDPDAMVWLTMDGMMDGPPITDFALAHYRLVDPGLGEQFTISIDVTDSVRRLVADGAEYAGFVFSCPGDGEFTLASVDLVDTVDGRSYLPKLQLVADFRHIDSDLDGSGRVDFVDFAILTSAWSSQSPDWNFNPAYDIQPPTDGKIDSDDLELFASQWLAETSVAK